MRKYVYLLIIHFGALNGARQNLGTPQEYVASKFSSTFLLQNEVSRW